MKTLILIYLLAKSAFKRKLTNFDRTLAYCIQLIDLLFCPEWVKMIVNMEKEESLPEAFGLFWDDQVGDLLERGKETQP